MSTLCDDRDRDSILRDLKSSDEEVRRLGVARVGTIGVEESIPLLVEGLGDPSWRVRKASVERLAACPDIVMAADALIPALGDGDNPGRRNAAVEALIQCGSEALAPLGDAIGTDDPDVRKLVADALAAIADGRSLPHVLCLVDDPDPNVRAATADALGAIGGEGAETALRHLATNAEEASLVRFSALHALSLQGKPMRASELGAALDDPTLCPAALLLLGRPDDEEAVPTLLKALAAPSRSAREAAMRSLLILIGRSDGARSEELVAQIREVADSSPTLVSSAIHRLADADLPTRLILVQFLGLSRIPAAVVPILRAGRDEALAEVSLSTLEALGPLAEDTLDGLWSDLDPGSRRDACTLLGRTDGGRGALRLLEALDDADPEVRIAAAR
ncbi:MAG: HEAT repeat domain-containing protein, partial [Myxococcota bacterium]